MDTIEALTVLAGSGITLALLSYLWRENLAFRIAEHAYIGASAGYGTLILAETAWRQLEAPLARGEWYWYLTVVMGLSYFFFFSKNYFWLYRYPIAYVIGNDIGVVVARSVKTQFLEQIRVTTIVTDVNAAIIAVGVITALFYFYATMEHKGVFKGVSKIGIYFMMGAFGASFGATVMARISLLIGRLRFLYFTEPAYYLIPVAIILLVIGIYIDRKKKT
jgi:hypothetical protein